jgi:ArsR family transcriptional regulator, arsenate/arsenite/antimonite-responsive transcriptional repressor
MASSSARSCKPAPRVMGADDRELAALAKAIAHPARVAILRFLLREGDCICGGIVDRLPFAQATVSQHLKILKDAGLLRGEIDGPRVCYCADPKRVERLKELLRGL